METRPTKRSLIGLIEKLPTNRLVFQSGSSNSPVPSTLPSNQPASIPFSK